MQTVTYTIPNISCMGCVNRIKTEVSKVEGVRSVTANPRSKETIIIFDLPATETKLVERLKAINCPPQGK